VQEPSKQQTPSTNKDKTAPLDSSSCESGINPLVTDVTQHTELSDNDNKKVSDVTVNDAELDSPVHMTDIGVGISITPSEITDSTAALLQRAQPALCSNRDSDSHSVDELQSSVKSHGNDTPSVKTTDNYNAHNTKQTTESIVQDCVVAESDLSCETVDVPTMEISSEQTGSSTESDNSSLTGLASHIDLECAKGVSEISSMNGVVQSAINNSQEGVDIADLDQELSNIPEQDSGSFLCSYIVFNLVKHNIYYVILVYFLYHFSYRTA
jgi:hypothetical protein